MANENSIDVYHALMALEEKVKGVAPDPENVTTDVALALADIFRTDAPMAQETAIVNAIDTITANYGGGGVDVGPLHLVITGDPTTQAGDELGSMAIIKLSIGDSVISCSFEDGNPYISKIDNAAEGVTVDVCYAPYNDEETAPSAAFKPCTISTEKFTYVTISDPIEVENTTYALTEGIPSSMWVTRFVMPELPEGSALFVTHAAE